MTDMYLLQNEFKKWLKIEASTLCFKASFYDAQISKLNESPIFSQGDTSFSDALENEMLCKNYKGIEKLFFSAFSKFEEIKYKRQTPIVYRAFEGYRIGLLKYKKFLFNYIAIRELKRKASNYFSEAIELKLQTILNSNTKYRIPIYHDNYVYDSGRVDALWSQLLKLINVETDEEHTNTNVHLGLETVIVKKIRNEVFEVVDGANTLITLSILLHIINAFSETEDKTEEPENMAALIRVKTRLNEQWFYNTLLNNSIDKTSTTACYISEAMSYRHNTLRLNMGYHFLQTMFHFTRLIQESKISQSDYFIEDLDAFKRKMLKTVIIKRKRLSDVKNDLPFFNNNTILLEHFYEWL